MPCYYTHIPDWDNGYITRAQKEAAMPIITVHHSYDLAPTHSSAENPIGEALLTFCGQLPGNLEEITTRSGLDFDIIEAGFELVFVQYGHYDMSTCGIRFELRFEVVLSEAAQMELRDELAEKIRKDVGMFIGSPPIRLDVYAGAWHGAIIDYSRVEPTW